MPFFRSTCRRSVSSHSVSVLEGGLKLGLWNASGGRDQERIKKTRPWWCVEAWLLRWWLFQLGGEVHNAIPICIVCLLCGCNFSHCGLLLPPFPLLSSSTHFPSFSSFPFYSLSLRRWCWAVTTVSDEAWVVSSQYPCWPFSYLVPISSLFLFAFRFLLLHLWGSQVGHIYWTYLTFP